MKWIVFLFFIFLNTANAKMISSTEIHYQVRGENVVLDDGHAFKLCENDTDVETTPKPEKYQKFSFYINSDGTLGALVANGVLIDSSVLIRDSSICLPKIANEEIIYLTGDIEIYNSFIQGFTIVDTSKKKDDDIRAIHINESEIIGTGEIRDKVAIYKGIITGDVDITGNVGDGVSITNSKLDFPKNSQNNEVVGSVNLFNVFSNGNLKIESSGELPSEFYKTKKRSSLVNLDRAWPTLFNINIGQIGSLGAPGFVGNFDIKNFASFNGVKLTGNACLNGLYKPGIRIHDGKLDFGTNNESKGLLGIVDIFDANINLPKYITGFAVFDDTDINAIDFCAGNVEDLFPIQPDKYAVVLHDFQSTGNLKISGSVKITDGISNGATTLSTHPNQSVFETIQLNDVEFSGDPLLSGWIELTTVNITGPAKLTKSVPPLNSDRILMNSVDIEGAPKISGTINFQNGRIENSPTVGGYLNIQNTTIKNNGSYVGDYDSKSGSSSLPRIILSGDNNNLRGFFEIYSSVESSDINGVGDSRRKGIYIDNSNIKLGPNISISGQVSISSSAIENGASIQAINGYNSVNCTQCSGLFISAFKMSGAESLLYGFGTVADSELDSDGKIYLSRGAYPTQNDINASQVWRIVNHGFTISGNVQSIGLSQKLTISSDLYGGNIYCSEMSCGVIAK